MIAADLPADRHAPARPELWDWLAGLAAVALSVWVLGRSGGGQGFRPAGPVAFVLTGLGAACLAWGRSRALPAVLTASTAATVLAWLDVHVDALPFVVTLLLFMAGSYLDRRRSLLALASAGIALVITAASRPADLGAAQLAQTSAIFAVAWAIGRLTRGRRLALLGQVAAAEQRAAAERALAAAERDRTALVRVEERLRIARELHDVLAHSISVISVQATVGEHLAGSEPGAAKQSLATIGGVARSSMQELRQLVTLLRDDSEPDAEPASYGAGPRTGRPRRPGRHLRRGRARGLPVHIRDGARIARVGPAVRLPDRPGGADEHPQTRRPGSRPAGPHLRPGRHAGGRDGRRTCESRCPRKELRRSRPDRHARADSAARRGLLGRWSAAASSRCSTPTPASRWSARRRTGSPRSNSAAPPAPT